MEMGSIRFSAGPSELPGLLATVQEKAGSMGVHLGNSTPLAANVQRRLSEIHAAITAQNQLLTGIVRRLDRIA